MLDLAAYLTRIGLSGRPALADIHRAHLTAIPFENLDPQRGVAVSLDLPAIERKLVSRRRGGYCFEHNLLFKAALEQLGAEVDLMLARVRVGSDPGEVRPRSHLVLRVRAGGDTWHADVGFGSGTLLEPIPFGPGEIHEQAGWRFHVVPEGPELVLRWQDGNGEWADLYGFVPEPVPMIDVETSNWYTCSHPSSRFVTGLIVARHLPDGTLIVMSDWGPLALTVSTPSGRTVTPVQPSEIPRLLDDRFGLPGWTREADGRIVATGDAPGHRLS
jgi:N-hydroxyarylamine O-acetyltransferase